MTEEHVWLAMKFMLHLFSLLNAPRTSLVLQLAAMWIMPDHVHLFVRGRLGFVLGRWVGMLKQSLAKAPRWSRKDAQIWQEGFFDHVLRNDESYAQKWEYVRENPVRAGLVYCSEDWPYQGEIVYIDRS
jgi:putative transposase